MDSMTPGTAHATGSGCQPLAVQLTAAPKVDIGRWRAVLLGVLPPAAVTQLHNQRRAFWKLQEKLQDADDRAKRAYAEVCRAARLTSCST